MHLTEDTYRLLVSGEEFPGCEALATHLETPCATCEAFLLDRRPEPVARRPRDGRTRSMRTENLAIVFTDIKGFTERTSRQTRAENERLLKLHEALLLPVFKAFGGLVRKSIGDAYLVTFDSPTNAVLCGIAAQDRLFNFNQSAPEADRIEVRVAINIGEVRVESNDVFGEPVNVAARIEGIAEANEIFFSEAVYLVMNKAEVPSVEVGSFELKGVPEKIRVYKVPRGPYRLGSGALATQNVPEPNLPYGGLGLARAGGLPAPDMASLERILEAQQSRRAFWAHRLVSVREAVESVRSASAVGPRMVVIGVGVVGLALVVLLGRSLLTPKVLRLIEGGEITEAGALIDAMPSGAERTFWRGRLEEKQTHWGDAIDDYASAARASASWHHRAINRLGVIAEAADCSAKVRVARAVGEIGDAYGRSVLEDLGKEKAQSAGGLSGLFGSTCDPRRAADAALKKLAGP